MDPVVAMAQLGGTATWPQLMELTTRRAVRTALVHERILRLRRDCYVLPGIDDARQQAALLGGVVSHLSAALDHGWKVKIPPELPWVTLPRNRPQNVPTRATVCWADLPESHVDGLVTSPARTVLDCARRLPFDEALAVADSALRAGDVSGPELLAMLEGGPRTGRGRARRVIECADPLADNPFESVLRAICWEIPGLHVQPQVWVGEVGRADLVDEALRLVIEADSFEHHAERADLRRDVRRYTGFVRLGYRVLRFTWEDVMLRPAYVRDVLTDVVRQAA